jgi:hypothetical protein
MVTSAKLPTGMASSTLTVPSISGALIRFLSHFPIGGY